MEAMTDPAPNVTKYHAVRTDYNGVRYDSKREAQYAAQLDMMKRAAKRSDRVLQWTRQCSVPLETRGVVICKLVLDFEVVYCDGRMEYHEVKGVETPVYKLKMKLFRALYPNVTVRIIK
jgi:hypothetical protein